MFKSQSYILGLVLILNVCLAIPMQSQKVLSLKVSKDGMSRISVASQRIEHVFAHPSSVNSSLQLHESGNLYVSPVGIEGPVFLSLITDNGVTQDLKLEFIDKSPQPIILQPKVANLYHKTHKNCQVWQVNGAKLQVIRSFWNAKYMLLEFSGSAVSEGKLYPEAFSRTGDVAVILSQSHVAVGDQFKVYILRRGGYQR